MPVIKSAQKKLRQDKKRTKRNDSVRENLKTLLKKAKKSRKNEAVLQAMKALDVAAKKNIIHKNKAARLKSKLSKLLKKEVKAKVTPKAKK